MGAILMGVAFSASIFHGHSRDEKPVTKTRLAAGKRQPPIFFHTAIDPPASSSLNCVYKCNRQRRLTAKGGLQCKSECKSPTPNGR